MRKTNHKRLIKGALLKLGTCLHQKTLMGRKGKARGEEETLTEDSHADDRIDTYS